MFTTLIGIGEVGTVGAAKLGIGVLDPPVRAVDVAPVLPVLAGSLRAEISSLGINSSNKLEERVRKKEKKYSVT